MIEQTIFTGKPCKRGHVSPRRAGNRDCLECIKLRHKSWYEANREADLARKAEWIEKNQDRKKAGDAAYYQKNSDKIRKQAARYYSENREAGMEARRRYRQSNLERLRAYDATRYAANPERVKALVRTRKARKRNADGKHTASDIAAISKAQRNCCAYCRVSLRKFHVDHIVPLSKGGSNWPKNLQLLCAPCNLAKHATDPMVYARRTGRLL